MPEQAGIGQFEQAVLTAILSLGDNAYGVTIHAAVQQLLDPRSVSLGAVYATLDRLEDKDLVTSWLSDPTPERGGRSKRHYRLEQPGVRALHDSAVAAKRIVDSVEQMWGTSTWKRGWRPARQG
jgi:PadR family transcriptional regulator PadR